MFFFFPQSNCWLGRPICHPFTHPQRPHSGPQRVLSAAKSGLRVGLCSACIKKKRLIKVWVIWSWDSFWSNSSNYVLLILMQQQQLKQKDIILSFIFLFSLPEGQLGRWVVARATAAHSYLCTSLHTRQDPPTQFVLICFIL